MGEGALAGVNGEPDQAVSGVVFGVNALGFCAGDDRAGLGFAQADLPARFSE